MHITDDEWTRYCLIPFQCSNDVRIRWFQYRILQRLIPTNSYLSTIKMIDSDQCDFCKSSIESIEHLFFYCPFSQKLWVDFNELLSKAGLSVNVLDVCVVIFGGFLDRMLNLIIILIKLYIFDEKKSKSKPSITGLKIFLRNYFQLQFLIHNENMNVHIWNKYWSLWSSLFKIDN